MIKDLKVMVGIHGEWGAGKTWLAHTLPGPRLVFDLEGQTELVGIGDIRYWDPVNGQDLADVMAWEDMDDTTTIVVDIPISATPIYSLLTWLETNDHPFNSVILDSFTEGQSSLKEHVSSGDTDKNGNPMFDQQAWGRLLSEGITIIRRFRNLTRRSARKQVNVAIVMGSDTEALPIRPLLQGGIRKRMLGYFNFFPYIHQGQDDEGTPCRVLQLRTSTTVMAKCNIHKVNQEWPAGQIINPDFKEILAVINEEKATA